MPVDERLTRERLREGLMALSERDADLRGVVERYGPPPLWARRPGFPTLVRIILEQQVSLASADAAYRRLKQATGPVTPRRFLRLDDASLLQIGFSRQKKGYVRLMAEDICSGRLNLAGLAYQDEAAVRATLLKVKGLGEWSIDIYLLMALRRPDAWPKSDLALMRAAQEVKGLEKLPAFLEMEALGEAWRPWRAVAARVLWHYYLSKKAGK